MIGLQRRGPADILALSPGVVVFISCSRSAIDRGCTYRSVSVLETAQSLLGALPLLLGDYSLENILCDLPECSVFLFNQQDDSGCLAVER